MKFDITEMGYTLITSLSEYKNNYTPIHTICSNGHVCKSKSYNNYQRGRICRTCWEMEKSSKSEKSIGNYVISLGYDISRNDRTIVENNITGNMLEIDIWIPELNKGIEFNGTYWHNNFPTNDDVKKSWCDEHNIPLMVIWDSEWDNNTDIVKENIKLFLDL